MVAHLKKDNNVPCFKCKAAPRYGKQTYCYKCHHEKTSAYQKNKDRVKRAKKGEKQIKSLKGEGWRPINIFVGYFVSDCGRVMSTIRKDHYGNIHTERILMDGHINGGYVKIALTCAITGNKKIVPLHRLVATAFLGEPPIGYVVNHKDGNKLNNIPSNLEWCTAAENSKHAWRTGLTPQPLKGEAHPNSKLNNKSVLEIRKQRASGALIVNLAKEYSVNVMTIRRVLYNENWTHI